MPAKKPVAKKKPASKRSSYSMQSQSQRNKVGRRALLFKSKAFAGAMILLVLAIAGLSFFIIQKKDSSSAATADMVRVSGGNWADCEPRQTFGDGSLNGCHVRVDDYDQESYVAMYLNSDVSYDLPNFVPNNPADDSTPGPTRQVTIDYGFYLDEQEPISEQCSYNFKVQADSQEKINNQFVTTSSKTLNLPMPSYNVQSDARDNFQAYNFYAGVRNNANPKRVVIKWLNNEFACSRDINLMIKSLEYSKAYNQTRDGKVTLNSTAQNVPQVLRVQTPSKISTGVVKATYLSEAESGYPFVSIPSGGFAEYKINAQSDIKYLQINEIVAKSGSGQLAFKLNGQLLKTTTTINSNGIKEKVILPVNIPKGSNKTLRIEAKNAKMLFTNITMSQNNDASLQQIYR